MTIRELDRICVILLGQPYQTRGGASRLARFLGMTLPGVTAWRAKGKVPEGPVANYLRLAARVKLAAPELLSAPELLPEPGPASGADQGAGTKSLSD